MLEKNDVVLLAKYMNIISTLVEDYRFDSLFKILFCSLVLKKKEEVCLVYKPSKQSNDYVSAFLGEISMLVKNDFQDIDYINEAFYLLSEKGFLSIEQDNVSIIKSYPHNFEYIRKYKSICEAISLISKMSTDSFCREVIRNV